jgi:hypothetical protein
VSHYAERSEKICLNCNTSLHGRFCHVCGQENKEPKDSFWHLLTHFVSDIFHFDGKFFSTARYLLTKPGFLSQEYIRGRRASYLDPIRMYIFISAIFFLVFFSFFNNDALQVGSNEKGEVTAAEMMQSLQKKKAVIENGLQTKEIPAYAHQQLEANLEKVNNNIALLARDSSAKDRIVLKDEAFELLLDKKTYSSEKAYDSAQQQLPAAKRDNWIERIIAKKQINTRNKYGSGHVLQEQFSEKFQHSIPQLLFVSLPFFALILQLLYVRKKQFYYVSHLIYTLHLYAAVFVFIFLELLISKLSGYSWLSWLHYLNILLTLYTVYYWYKSMRVFYAQGRGITILKFVLVWLLGLVLLVLLFILFVVLSFIRL